MTCAQAEPTPYFWEHSEVQERLWAMKDTVHVSVSDSESEDAPRRVQVKKISELSQKESVGSSASSQWLQGELNECRLRERNWRVRYDRADPTGNGDHRILTKDA